MTFFFINIKSCAFWVHINIKYFQHWFSKLRFEFGEIELMSFCEIRVRFFFSTSTLRFPHVLVWISLFEFFISLSCCSDYTIWIVIEEILYFLCSHCSFAIMFSKFKDWIASSFYNVILFCKLWFNKLRSVHLLFLCCCCFDYDNC